MFFRSQMVLFLCACVFAFAAIAAAGSFDTTWKSTDAQPVNFAGKKVAVVVLSKSRSAGLAAEDTLARAITLRGADGVSGHTLATESELKDKEKAKEVFQKAGMAGVIVIQGEPEGKEPIDPNAWKDKNFWEAYGGPMNFDNNTSGSQKDVKIYVETLVYSVEQDKLLWVGTSETKISKIDEFIEKILDSVAEEMTDQGLLNKK